MLENIDKFLKKLWEYSKIYEESLHLPEKLYLLILRSFKMNYDFEKSLIVFDKEKNIYITKNEMMQLLLEIPIGLTEIEIDSLLDEYKLDECNNILYPYIFDKVEYQTIKAVNEKKTSFHKDKYF